MLHVATVSHIFLFLVACTKFPEFFKTPPTFAIWMSRSKQTAKKQESTFFETPCMLCMYGKEKSRGQRREFRKRTLCLELHL